MNMGKTRKGSELRTRCDDSLRIELEAIAQELHLDVSELVRMACAKLAKEYKETNGFTFGAPVSNPRMKNKTASAISRS